MSEQPDLSTLPRRMEYAAKVLAESTEREQAEGLFCTNKWTPNTLAERAGQWRQEESEARRKMIEDLAEELWTMPPGAAMGWSDAKDSYRDVARSAARALFASGWRKGDPE